MVKAKITKVNRISNASALAKELGVGREHLWRVVTGRRESRRLTAALRKRGFTFGTTAAPSRPVARPRKEGGQVK